MLKQQSRLKAEVEAGTTGSSAKRGLSAAWVPVCRAALAVAMRSGASPLVVQRGVQIQHLIPEPGGVEP